MRIHVFRYVLVLSLMNLFVFASTKKCAEYFMNFARTKLPANSVDIEEIRQAIQEGGIYTVYPWKSSKDKTENATIEMQMGTPIVFAGDYSRDKVHRFDGVFLHPLDTDDLNRANHVLGKYNLHIYGDNDALSGKTAEMIVLRKYSPQSIAESKIGNELVSNSKKIMSLRKQLIPLIRQGDTSIELKGQLKEYLIEFFKIAKDIFGEAFIKIDGEYQTGDGNKLITTMKTDPQKLLEDFWAEYETLANSKRAGEISSIKRKFNYTKLRATQVVSTMLFEPESTLVQKKMDLELTESGHPMELRVDVIGGIPLRAVMRHSMEYLPQDLALRAIKFVKDTIDKFPDEFRRISGGWDVMVLKNGSFAIVETNNGSESGYMMGDNDPIHTNLGVMALTGKPTPLIILLDSIHESSIEDQIQFVKNMKNDPVFNDPDILNYNMTWTIEYFRDKYIREWSKNPTLVDKQSIMEKLNRFILEFADAPKSVVDEINEIVNSADSYMTKQLKKNQ